MKLTSLLSSLFRFRLHFEKESKADVEKGKKLAREKVLQPVSEKELEIAIDTIYPPDKGLSVGPLYCFYMMVSVCQTEE